MIKVKCAAPLTWSNNVSRRYIMTLDGGPSSNTDKYGPGTRCYFTTETWSKEVEVPYGQWLPGDAGGTLGAHHIVYKDVGGKEHTYNSLQHLKGNGEVSADSNLAKFFYNSTNPSDGILTYNVRTGQLNGSTNWAWSWNHDGGDFVQVDHGTGYRRVFLYESFQDSRVKCLISIGRTHNFYKNRYYTVVDEFYDFYANWTVFYIVPATWGGGPNSYAMKIGRMMGDSKTVREPGGGNWEQLLINAAQRACEDVASHPLDTGSDGEFIPIPNLPSLQSLGNRVDAAARRIASLLPSWDQAHSELDETGRLADYASNNIPNWTALSARALEKYTGEFDGNGFAYLKDCKEFIPSIRKMRDQFAATAKGLKGRKLKMILAGIAGTYLSIHYGFKLFALDTEELLEATLSSTDGTVRHLNSHESYFRYNWDADRRYTIAFDKSPIIGTMREFLAKYDLLFNSHNAWDLVPYSFVVDWFTDLESALTSLDTYGQIRRDFQVAATIGTTRATKNVECNTDYCHGSVEVEYFNRFVSHDIVTPDIWAAADPGGFSKKHLVEGTALTAINL